MAHFAQLDENGMVIEVIVVSDQDTMDENGIEKEEIGIKFLQSMFGDHTKWKQTSYNNNIRKHYAGIGMTYNESLDAFIPIKPFSSWILDEETCLWISPVPMPELTEEQINQGYFYQWDEDSYQKENIGWILRNVIDMVPPTVIESLS